MGPDSLTVRFDDGDRAIERGARLLVAQSQVAQFVYMGRYGDLFPPGEYQLHTDTIPLLTRIASWRYGFESPFKADIYFVATKLFTGCKWGTAHPIMVQDPRLGVVRLRAHGTYDFRIVDIPLFLSNVAGTDHNFTLAEFHETMKARVASAFAQALSLSGLEPSLVATRHHELGAAFLPSFNQVVTPQYGIELTSLIVESVSLPPEVEQIVDAAASTRALGGDLQTYLQVQLARALGQGGPGTLSAPSELALGLTASKMIGNNGGLSPVAPAALPSPSVLPQLPLSEREAYSIDEAAASFSLPVELIQEAVADGRIPAFNLLGKQLIRSADIHALMRPAGPTVISLTDTATRDNGVA